MREENLSCKFRKHDAFDTIATRTSFQFLTILFFYERHYTGGTWSKFFALNTEQQQWLKYAIQVPIYVKSLSLAQYILSQHPKPVAKLNKMINSKQVWACVTHVGIF